jgi:hypothetical protein
MTERLVLSLRLCGAHSRLSIPKLLLSGSELKLRTLAVDNGAGWAAEAAFVLSLVRGTNAATSALPTRRAARHRSSGCPRTHQRAPQRAVPRVTRAVDAR